MIFYHVIFYHDILSYDILSYDILSYDILSYDILSYDFTAWQLSRCARFIFQRNLKNKFSGDWRAALKVNNGG